MAELTNERKSQLRKAITELEGLSAEDKSALIELLNTHKKYGLVWEDKSETVEEALREKLPLLTEVKERAIVSDSPDSPNHILIEGDNLEALTALSYTHEGKIDVIYIDPPYNTGNKDFSYNDSFVDSEDAYRHSKWLSFMSKRLKLAKRLLSDKGVIFISIDDNEQANLKLLCDEIFGGKIEQYVWCLQDKAESSFVKTAGLTVRKEHEYIVACFVKNDTRFKKYRGERDFATNITTNPDNDPRGPWFSGNISRNGIKSTTGSKYYTITNPAGESFTRNWTLSKEEYEEALKDNRIYFAKGGAGVPRIKIFSNANSLLIQSSLFTDVHTSITGKNELKAIFTEAPFQFPKPTTLISRLIQLVSDLDSIILDFFAGSGTTLHATMQLNTEDGGKRKCILVTNNENKICEEVTYERNKRVINGYTTPKGEKVEGLTNNTLRYYKTTLVSRERTQQNMRELVSAATELLCVKEDLYEEKKTFGKYKVNPRLIRYFDDGKSRMLVIYREEVIDEVVAEIENMNYEGKMKIYLFAPGRYAFDDNFYSVHEKVTLCALPAAIYDAYEKVLPKRKIVETVELESQEEQIVESEKENEQTLFQKEGGEQ